MSYNGKQIVMALTDTGRTGKQIVDDANALAWEFYAAMGYHAPQGYRFDQAFHPQEQSCWRFACLAYERIQGTDVQECLDNMEDE